MKHSIQPWTLTDGKVLLNNQFSEQTLHCNNKSIQQEASGSARQFNAAGLLLVPGIVDIHGDGFERNISPRPGVLFDVEEALRETDRQLLCNGITTAYLAMTISWEPGLRSLPMARELVDAVIRLQDQFFTDIRIQLRWEIAATEAVPHVLEWIEHLPTPALAINDHFTQLLTSNKARKIPEYAKRAGMEEDDYLVKMRQMINRPEEIAQARNTLISGAQKAGIGILSHDEPDPRIRQVHRKMGIGVCEFPLTSETARDARSNDEPVILGAPNVVRGGSHIGAMDATTAIEEDLCSILASDYYYPSLLKAVSTLAGSSESKLAKYWGIISGNPALASKLIDRGQLTAGKKADILALSMQQGKPRIEAVFIDGKPVFVADISRTSG